jgi:3-dehydroquinate dehydratase-2
MAMKLMVINGPNLNFLGIREKSIYGSRSFKEIENYIRESAISIGHDIEMCQSNVEGEIIDFIQRAYYEKCDGIIINPGAFTHYSYAIYDAIKSVNIDTVEVHLSQIYSREEFRQKSVTASACIGQICGFGEYGYVMAMKALENRKKASI